jgi:sporulation protein YlmC with PRC-barrel domain
MKVITANAKILGEIDGVRANLDTWQITNLEVTLTNETIKEFGFKKPFLGSLSVCLPITAVKQVGDTITLNYNLEEVKNLKECRVE